MIATLMAVLFILYYFEATTITKTNMEDTIGPGAFPQLISIFGLFLCVCFFIPVFRGAKNNYEKTIGFWDEIKGIAIIFMVIGYVFLIDLVGYSAATFAFMTIGVKFLGERTWYISAIVAAVLTLACFLFFQWFLDITFSTGDFWLMIMGE